MEELIKTLPKEEINFLLNENNKELTNYFYNKLYEVKLNNLEKIITCENSSQRKIVHILSQLLSLNHAKYYKWNQSWKKDFDFQCACKYCYDSVKDKFHCEVLGVKVSTQSLDLCKKDKQQQKRFNKVYNNYNLMINELKNENIPDWLEKKRFKKNKNINDLIK
jgi:hypothetical protein